MILRQIYLALRKRLLIAVSGRFYVRRINGIYFLLDLLNYIDRQIDAFGQYEAKQQAAFLNLIAASKPRVFVDVGANWGYYSLIVCSRLRNENIRIMAFEPDVVNRHQMSANMFLNGFSDTVEIYDFGLSDKSERLCFERYSDENRGRSRVSDSGNQVILTKVFDDEFLIKDDRIIFKIDVEGHEVSVLKGMLETLKNNQCVLQIEAFGDNLALVEKVLSECSYEKIASIESDHYFTNIAGIECIAL